MEILLTQLAYGLPLAGALLVIIMRTSEVTPRSLAKRIRDGIRRGKQPKRQPAVGTAANSTPHVGDVDFSENDNDHNLEP